MKGCAGMDLKTYFVPNQKCLTKRLWWARAIFVVAVVFGFFDFCLPALSGFSLAEACLGLVVVFLTLLNAVMLLPVAVWGSRRQRVPVLLGAAFLLFLSGGTALSLLLRAGYKVFDY
ncbi:MAG: hypothetical protein M2R45_04190 [Verrucomicrobia subdivision 3 bacterium]|nr:hypothetical protein [Limisphaerales bacterium]MCS1413005.1 hypothetical protein [Limisphaerales bacterium]